MDTRRSSQLDNYKFCSACGHSNPPWSKTCERCKAELEELPKPTVSGSRGRPGCVTAYAVIVAISATLTIVGGIIFSLSGTLMNQYFNEIRSFQGMDSTLLRQILGFMVPAILIITFLSGIFNLLIAWGLWRLKNWARIVVIVLQSLGILGNIYSMVTTFFTPPAANSEFAMASSYGTICVSLVSLIIGGYIVFWFVTNKDYFS